jgi:VanZ family protein
MKFRMERIKPQHREPASRWHVLAVLALGAYWIALFGATHIPRLPLPTHYNLTDKVCHFVAFAILTFLAHLAWANRRRGVQPVSWRDLCAVLLVVAAYGMVDEATQPLVGRSREFLDWLADVTGALLATLVFAGLWSVTRRSGSLTRRSAENAPA